MYAYRFFYYFERSGMFGFMQTSFFFGYMLMASYAFIMLGTRLPLVARPVRRIYAAIKGDYEAGRTRVACCAPRGS